MDDIIVEDMIRKDLWLSIYKTAFAETTNDYAAELHAEGALEAYDKQFNDKGDGLV